MNKSVVVDGTLFTYDPDESPHWWDSEGKVGLTDDAVTGLLELRGGSMSRIGQAWKAYLDAVGANAHSTVSGPLWKAVVDLLNAEARI